MKTIYSVDIYKARADSEGHMAGVAVNLLLFSLTVQDYVVSPSELSKPSQTFSFVILQQSSFFMVEFGKFLWSYPAVRSYRGSFPSKLFEMAVNK